MTDQHYEIWHRGSINIIERKAPNTLWGQHPEMTKTLFNNHSRAVSGDKPVRRNKSVNSDIRKRRRNLKKNISSVRAGRKSTKKTLSKKRKILFNKR